MGSHVLPAGALAAFLGAFVEAVEALTIVLAVGIVRGWREALGGAALGACALGVLLIAATFGLVAAPAPALRAIAGLMALGFGARWLRKAILRAAGRLALRDEARAFSAEADLLTRLERPAGRLDRIALAASFNAVLTEGIEIVFIVVAVSAGSGSSSPAATGAALAVAAVMALGVLLRRPLTRIPENALKFLAGVQLTSFGILWLGEAAKIRWPGGDLAIFALSGVVLLASLAAARLLRKRRGAAAG